MEPEARQMNGREEFPKRSANEARDSRVGGTKLNEEREGPCSRVSVLERGCLPVQGPSPPGSGKAWIPGHEYREHRAPVSVSFHPHAANRCQSDGFDALTLAAFELGRV